MSDKITISNNPKIGKTQHAESIVINSYWNGGPTGAADGSGCFITPIRDTPGGDDILFYHPDTKEITHHPATHVSGTSFWGASATQNFYGPSGTAAPNITGDYNTACGVEALRDSTAGDGNVAIGCQALRGGGTAMTADHNVAIGYQSMVCATTGANNPQRNVAVGYLTLESVRQGQDNVAVGADALSSGEDCKGNVAVGGDTLHEIVEGDYNTAIGYRAGYDTLSSVNNSIFISAGSGGSGAGPFGSSSCYIAPIRPAANNNALYYNASTKEITYDLSGAPWEGADGTGPGPGTTGATHRVMQPVDDAISGIQLSDSVNYVQINARSNASLTIGDGTNEATGSYSFAVGQYCKANDDFRVAMGDHAQISGATDTFFKYQSIAGTTGSWFDFTDNPARLRVHHDGDPAATYAFVSTGGHDTATKTFIIPHPNEAGKMLRHACIEAPTRGTNIYEFQVTIAKANVSTKIALPTYFAKLNGRARVYVSAVNVFSHCYGAVDKTSTNVVIQNEKAGTFNVMVTGVRKDPGAVKYSATENIDDPILPENIPPSQTVITTGCLNGNMIGSYLMKFKCGDEEKRKKAKDWGNKNTKLGQYD